ncbi:MAG: hypothetical protein S4CHLAM45_08450 [Chlamydiales bacterium]|nr:hypothetical protein [Chlamydiales bacterium]MCH9620405.1 hypothetical protein [Chlamydiales bacterium]MCH9622949.1 hypothetical protein [Chlamydiales bacterium]
MIKESGYQEKIELVEPWFDQVIEVVKKDLKQEHIKIDRDFCRRYFMGKGANMISSEEMAQAYLKDIAGGNTGLGEFIASRWLLKNTDIYNYFDEKLRVLTPDFEELEEFEQSLAQSLLEESISQFGAARSYIFAIFNSVVFSDEIYHNLRELALKQTGLEKKQKEEKEIERSLEAMQKRHDREIAALGDRYEKKLSGLRKKYLNDTTLLKKQLNTLQKKQSDG